MSSMKIMNPRVDWFVQKMRDKLRQNTHKTDSRLDTILQLENKMKAEVLELRESIKFEVGADQIISECADIANYAMMIADKANQEQKEKDK